MLALVQRKSAQSSLRGARVLVLPRIEGKNRERHDESGHPSVRCGQPHGAHDIFYNSTAPTIMPLSATDAWWSVHGQRRRI